MPIKLWIDKMKKSVLALFLCASAAGSTGASAQHIDVGPGGIGVHDDGYGGREYYERRRSRHYDDGYYDRRRERHHEDGYYERPQGDHYRRRYRD